MSEEDAWREAVKRLQDKRKERDALQRQLADLKDRMKEMPGVGSLDIEELSLSYEKRAIECERIEKQLEDLGN